MSDTLKSIGQEILGFFGADYSARRAARRSFQYGKRMFQEVTSPFVAEQAGLQRDWSALEAHKQREFQRGMSNTAYRRAMFDIRQAGLNPMLAYTQGGASSPAGSMPSGASASGSAGFGPLTGDRMIEGASAMAAIRNMRAQNKLIKKQQMLIDAQRGKVVADTGKVVQDTRVSGARGDIYESVAAPFNKGTLNRWRNALTDWLVEKDPLNIMNGNSAKRVRRVQDVRRYKNRTDHPLRIDMPVRRDGSLVPPNRR